MPNLSAQNKPVKTSHLRPSNHLSAKTQHSQLPHRLLPQIPSPQFSSQPSSPSSYLSTHQIPTHISPKHLSDKDLYSRCQLYGGNAKKWLQKFAGLLPEVYRRFLYKKHGCGSIHEFAQKLSGMHERTVNKILNLHERLEDKPHLLALFESGTQGWTKLEAVAFIATSKTEKDLAEKVTALPQKALYAWVKNFRDKLTVDGQSRLGNDLLNLQAAIPMASASTILPGQPPAAKFSPSIFNSDITVPATGFSTDSPHAQLPATFLDRHSFPPQQSSPTPVPQTAQHSTPSSTSPYPETFTNFSFPISTLSRQKLNIVKLTLEKQHRQTLTWNEVIQLWPIHNQKIIVKKVCPTCALKLASPAGPSVKTGLSYGQPKSPSPLNSTPHKSPTQPPNARPPATTPPPSRPIPTTIKNLILATHGQTCVFPGCNQAFTDFHHLEPFAIHKTHNPNRIYPICSTHHTLFHAGLIANSEKPPAFWEIRNEAKQNYVDKKVMRYKMKT